MGIWLAIRILDGRAQPCAHGGADEACDELVRESFWMTDAELDHVLDLTRKEPASAHAQVLVPALSSERQKRRQNAPVGLRVN